MQSLLVAVIEFAAVFQYVWSFQLEPVDMAPRGQRAVERHTRATTASFARVVEKSAKRHKADDLIDWKLCNATVHSNLGGMGPDSGESGIRFSSIATTENLVVDLLITNTTPYSASSTDNNGLKECFGLINVLSPSETTLQFQLVKSGTTELIDPSHTMFTVYDLDESKKGIGEEITFESPVDGYFLMPDSELITTGSAEGGLTFSSTEIGSGEDNPSDPETMTNEQELRAVTVEFTSASEYTITFKAVGEEQKKTGGRNFLFAGKSDLPDEEDVVHSVCGGSTCEIWADPHVAGFDNTWKGPIAFVGTFMSTFDRNPVDVYDTGDFWLVKHDSVHIQGRYHYSAEFGRQRTAVGAVAVGGPFLKGSRLTIEPKSGTVQWNGVSLGEKSESLLRATSETVRVKTYYNASLEDGSAPSGVDVDLPLGLFLRVRRFNTHLDLKLTMKRLLGSIDGQCGNYNGDSMDDSLESIKKRMPDFAVQPEDSLFNAV